MCVVRDWKHILKSISPSLDCDHFAKYLTDRTAFLKSRAFARLMDQSNCCLCQHKNCASCFISYVFPRANNWLGEANVSVEIASCISFPLSIYSDFTWENTKYDQMVEMKRSWVWTCWLPHGLEIMLWLSDPRTNRSSYVQTIIVLPQILIDFPAIAKNTFETHYRNLYSFEKIELSW